MGAIMWGIEALSKRNWGSDEFIGTTETAEIKVFSGVFRFAVLHNSNAFLSWDNCCLKDASIELFEY